MIDIIFFEDVIELAEDFFRHLNLSNAAPIFCQDDKNLEKVIGNNFKKKVYIIDLKLSDKIIDLGLEVIKRIREVDSESLIIVYTAYQDYESLCYKIGVNFFFAKSSNTYKNDIKIIRNIIEREIHYAKN